MSIPIGIDLGTSTSEITAWQDGQWKTFQDNSAATPTEVVPSVVAYDPQSQQHLVGELAESYPDCIREAKRKMGKTGEEARCSTGGKDLKPEEVGAVVLKHLKAIAEESLFGDTVTDVILTIPAIFSQKARIATKTAGELAGLNIVQLINEPVAAALYYAFLAGDKWKDGIKTLFVFDFGGGTLDFTVCTMAGNIVNFVCSGGDPQLGGKDIDEMFMAYVTNKFMAANPGAKQSDSVGVKAMLKNQCILCKKSLTRSETGKIYVSSFATDNGRPIDLDLSISRDEFNENVLKNSPIPGKDSIINRIKVSLDNLFEQNKERTSMSDIDYLLFVGGSSYIPYVQEYLKEYLGIDKSRALCQEPNLAVTRGAAYFAANREILNAADPEAMGIQLGLPENKRVDVFAVSPHGIGCEITDRQTGGRLYSQWFPPQQQIPFEGSFGYSLLTPDQTSLRFSIYQSMIDEDGQDIEDTEFTGCENQIVNIPPSTDGTCRAVTTEVKYDESGLLHAIVTIPSTGQSMTLEYKESAMTSEASKRKIAEFTKK